MGGDFAAMPEEQAEQAVLLDGEMHVGAGAGDGALGEIDLDVAEAGDGKFGCGLVARRSMRMRAGSSPPSKGLVR